MKKLIIHGTSMTKQNSKETLQDLLDKCRKKIPLTQEDKQWLQTHPVGKEYGSEEKLPSQSE